MDPTPTNTADLLSALAAGDRSAFDKLFVRVQGELQVIADREMRQERPGQTVQPMDMVNEVFLKLVKQGEATFRDRNHFLAIAATSIRHLLVDRYRQRRRRPAREALPDSVAAIEPAEPVDLHGLDVALTELAALRPLQAKIIELTFFGGLTQGAAAEVLEISPRSLQMHSKAARVWLKERLQR